MKKLTESFLNILYPRRCPLCHEILKEQDSLICETCRKTLNPIEEPRCYKCGKPVREGEEYCSDCASVQHFYDRGRGIFCVQREDETVSCTL